MVFGRIIKGVGGQYSVATDEEIYTCSVRGVFRKRNITPTVGDFVSVEVIDEGKLLGSIVEINERKNQITRPRVVNVDQVIIVFSAAKPAIDCDMLDRFIVHVEACEIDIVIVVNKIDLSVNYKPIQNMYESAGFKVIPVSIVCSHGQGVEQLRDALEGKNSVFAGPSGVGKSSIINALLSCAKMETGSLSLKLERGKHTTRHSELMGLDCNSFIVDSPGFTSLDMDELNKERLPWLFREFRKYLGLCRFNNCRHINEPDCEIKAHVGIEISPQRYNRYVEFDGLVTKK